MDARIRRIEEASLNAWPALTQLLYDGWVVRMTHGFTRRANSVTPLDVGGARELLDKIRWCENFYARHRQATVFRLLESADGTPIPGGAALRTVLLERGYREEEPTRVLHAALTVPGAAPLRPALRFTDRDRWLEAYGRLTGAPEASRPLHALILRGIAGDCLHALAWDGERPVACGLGVVEDDLLGLFDVATDSRHRRQGHGHRLIAALHARGAALGARHAYLQMARDNTPAEALYARFGYRDLYRYSYLRAPS